MKNIRMINAEATASETPGEPPVPGSPVEETGERMVINNSNHSFFFVPMHWAGVVIVVIGIGVAVSDAFN